MEEDRMKDDKEFNEYMRRNLCDLFGPFEEFQDRVIKGLKHGVIKSKMKLRTAPFAPIQVQDSPSHVPIHVALQSMRNLVEEPLSALPTELLSLKTASPIQKGTPGKNSGDLIKGSGNNNGGGSSGGGGKRKFDGGGPGEKQLEPRRKKMPNSEPHHRDEDDGHFPFSPDSGVHSTENELTDESATVETMLSIMTSLEEPQISPLHGGSLIWEKEKEKNKEKIKEKAEKLEKLEKSKSKSKSPPRKEPEIKKKVEKKLEMSKREKEKEKERPVIPKVTLRFPDGSTTSSASTSREVSPEVSSRKPPRIVSGHMKLDVLKTERLKKLIKQAESKGKLSKEDVNSKTEQLERDMVNGRASSRASTKMETPTPTRTQTPESSSTPTPKKLPIKEKSVSRSQTPVQSQSTQSTQKPVNKTVHHLSAEKRQSPASPRSMGGSSMNTPTMLSRPSSSQSTHQEPPKRWTCQWEHSKQKSLVRVPMPDPTAPNPKSKGEFYHDTAKEWKRKADSSKDRVLRPLHYMLSSVFFVLEAIWKTEKERTPQARMQCASIYRDTCELLGVAVFQGVKDSDDAIVVHILPRIKVLGQIMLSVMQYQMYILRSDQAIKTHSRLETPEVANCIETHANSNLTAPDPSQGWAASLTNSAASFQVTMPQIVYNMMRTQIKTAHSLILASRYWEDSKNLAKQVDERFVKHIETICGRSIGMDTSFEHLAQFVLTAVASLKAEYEEEQKLPVRPVLAKMKPVLDVAIKTGSFHSSAGDRSHRTSQSTPRIPTATSTPQPTPAPPI